MEAPKPSTAPILSEDKKAGIAWAGSLVGSKNPNAPTGYRYSNKRYRLENDSSQDLPSNIQVSFRNRQGDDLAETMDLPISSTIDDLNALVNQLSQQTESSNVTYSFYASLKETADTPVESDLKNLFTEHALSTENVLVLTYQPLALFRVRPVTRCTDTLQGHTDSVLHVSYSGSGTWLASGGGDCCVRFWDVRTATCQYKFDAVHKDHVLCTAWSPDAQRFASGDKRGNLVIWNMAAKPPVPQTIYKAHSKWISSLAWEPLHVGEERLATASKDGSIKLWNARTRKVICTLSGHTDSVEVVKWGAEFVYSASRDRTIKVWNADRGILVKTLVGHGHRVNTLALNCDSVLRCGPFDYKNVSFPDGEARRKAALDKFETFREQHPHDVLVSGSDDFTLFVWHPTISKHPIKRLTGHQQAVNHISFAPDGRHFASASFDKKIKIWNGATGDFLQTLTGHVGAVYQVAWSADSRHLVTASKDSTAKLWNIGKSKTAIYTLPGHADEVYALDWSPTSGAVATGSKDRTIKIWKH